MLPKYRGASPVQHAILNGENEIGVTYQLMDKGMDTGKIINQFSYKLGGNETTEILYDILFEKAANMLPATINQYLNHELIPYKQNEEDATYCYSPTHPESTYIYKDDAKINWNSCSLKHIYNMIRAYYPWPISWTTVDDINSADIKVTDKGLSTGTLKNDRDHVESLQNNKNSKLILKSDKNLKIKIYKAEYLPQNNELKIDEIQVEGKNIVGWKDFINGYAVK